MYGYRTTWRRYIVPNTQAYKSINHWNDDPLLVKPSAHNISHTLQLFVHNNCA